MVEIALAPLSIAPNPLVIEPEFNAPVVTMLDEPAVGEAPISVKTSLALLPSRPLAVNLAKSSSATLA